MPRTVEIDEFATRARELVSAVAGGDDSIVVVQDGAPVAVLSAVGANHAQAVLADLPRWEEWVHEVRESIAEAAGGALTPQMPLPDPPAIDKVLLGFDPPSGLVGSEAGREFLAGELARLNVPVRDEGLLANIYAAVIRLCEDKERLYEADLRVLAQQLIAEAPARLRLLAVTVTSSTGLPATAEVTVELGQGPAMRREHGDGPLDAAIRAIQRLTQLEPIVENFSVVSATPGQDAMAEAVIELAMDDRRAVGAGASTNAIEAGIQAYVNALNFLLEARTPTSS
ncbi:MAG TPA: alpha-isopropylmalate synthase regulatory domain-containing protein [Candidatus Dormibacteraeota bacterium]|nr:alpha-isopropylmalate synthase regulatory domain-containing protein [Candidatus Dormibacteraeota bacterium]